MSTGNPQGDPLGAGAPMSEEELRAAYEAELKKIRVEQVLLENVVSLINLGMRRTGLSPGTEDERDLAQVRVAIDSIRALLPVVERSAAAQAGPIRDALSQLQMAFVKLGGTPESPGGEPEPGREPSGGAGGSEPGPGGPGSGPGGPGSGPGGPGSGPGGPGSGPGGPGSPGSGPGTPGSGPEPAEPKPGEPGPAQRSGRLWVPGQ